MWWLSPTRREVLTEAFPLLEGHHFHGFLKRSHICSFRLKDEWEWRRAWRGSGWSPCRWMEGKPHRRAVTAWFLLRLSWEESECVAPHSCGCGAQRMHSSGWNQISSRCLCNWAFSHLLVTMTPLSRTQRPYQHGEHHGARILKLKISTIPNLKQIHSDLWPLW